MIELAHVTKLFGPREDTALAMARQGASKDEIRAATGATLALSDVTLSIAAGEICVLMGLSGSGKSTLVRHVNRLIEPSSGDIRVGGVDVRALNPADLRAFRRDRISMVFQGFGLLPHLNVLENVAFGLAARGEPRETCHAKAETWIEAVGLTSYEDALPDALSGGMKQRVGLARALAVDTDIVLMDEAFSALDPLTRADMQDMLINLQARLSKTLVFVTHDLDEAIRLGDRIVIMRDGKIIQTGTPAEILSAPADDYVARFVKAQAR